MTEPVPSPCISVCLLEDNDICVGCYRSAEEITQWMECSEDEKREILKRCNQRRKDDQGVVFK